MGLACNLDRKGRVVRGVAGGLLIASSLVLCIAVLTEASTGLRLLGLIPGLLGLFAIFESVNGWCAVRALGFKTWI